MKYEVFLDSAYYDMWAVRPVGESRWGHCYHLASKEEAQGLAEQLEKTEKEALEAKAVLNACVDRIDSFEKRIAAHAEILEKFNEIVSYIQNKTVKTSFLEIGSPLYSSMIQALDLYAKTSKCDNDTRNSTTSGR